MAKFSQDISDSHSKSGPIVDGRHLRFAGRAIAVPFRIQLRSDGQLIELKCTKVLRILPRKRLVCFCEWNGHQAVAKLFLASGKAAKRHFAREKRGLNACESAGIGALVLAFQRIIPSLDFEEKLGQAESDEQSIELLSKVADVIACQHEAGLKHNDLHPGNFLFSGKDIYTIDGDDIDVRKMGSPLAKGESLTNLALFFAQFYPKFDQLVPEVFQVYSEKRSWPISSDLQARLMKEVQRRRSYRKKKYLNKVYRECSAFVCRKTWSGFMIKTWSGFMICDRDYHTEAMNHFLDDPDPVIDGGSLLKDGNTSTVALVEVDRRLLVVKRYNINNFWYGLKRCLRPSRAWTSWRNAHRLMLLGIATPKPIMLAEKRWGVVRSTAYFITEYVEGVDVYHLLHSDSEKKMSQEGLIKLVEKLFQQLTDASISHGDFKATNLIPSGGELFIIDLDAMREHRFRWRFIKAFKRDCERFMKNWKDLPEVEKLFYKIIEELEERAHMTAP
ncbi:MAG: hypothetical protein JRJ15_14840 [Deltaproteobacteria bacterium]|nr:hypothetical protein [Deltaproteobacteria bacterium]